MAYQYEIDIGNNKYPYYLSVSTAEIVAKLSEIDTNHFVLIYDSKLDHSHVTCLQEMLSPRFQCNLIELEISEAHKDMHSLGDICDKILSCGATRSACIVAIGCGVLGNIVGLAASLLFRGIRLIHIPTTIIAAADSVLSLKQAVNTAYGKNLIGTFYKPYGVYTDYNFFSTLSERDYKAGTVELVKNLLTIIPEHIEDYKKVVKGKLSYTFDEFKFILDLSIQAKCKVLKDDMLERKAGLVLEYGHTIGHAVEFLSKGEIRHGEGVAFGMLVMGEIGRELGYINEAEMNAHYELLETLDIYEELKTIRKHSIESIMDIVKYDNKRGYIKSEEDSLALVLLDSLGNCCKSGEHYVKLVKKSIIEVNLQRVFDKIAQY